MKLKTFTTHPHIILFDGLCNLCNGSVNFIIQNDPKAKFKFAPLQSAFAGQLLNPTENQMLSSIIYFQNGIKFERSTAALQILKELDHPLQSLHHLKSIPAFLRDPIYNLTASTRYSLFGKREECMVPTEEISARFIQD